MRPLPALSVALCVAACAHAPETPTGPADFSPVAVTPAPNARLYADCISEAAAGKTYGRAFGDSAEMILFTCAGDVARRFYDALGPHSARVGSEVTRDGRTWRSTNPVRANLFGVDYCWADGDRHECVISLRTGEFIRP